MSGEPALIQISGLKAVREFEKILNIELEYILETIMRIFLSLLFYSDEIMMDYSLVKLNEC